MKIHVGGKPLNIAVVGCGRVSYKHFQAITELAGEARLCAVCDIDPAKARAAGEQHGVPWFTSYHEMLARHPEIDVINVLVPTGYHAQVVIELARHGKTLVVEKPMALTVADCEAMIQTCQQHGTALFVVYQNRYNTPVQAARLAWEQGRFGKAVLGTVRVRWCRHQDYYEQDDWHGTWALDGGVMSQQASHHLDLLQWFMGPVESVHCEIATRLLDIEVEDTATAILRFRSGALGVFEATVATRPDNLEGSLSLLGERGTAVIAGVAVNALQTWTVTAQHEHANLLMTQATEVVANVYGNGHTRYLADIIRSLRTGSRAPHLVDGEQGKQNIMLLTALYESAHDEGRAIIPGALPIKSPLGRRGLSNIACG